MDLVWFIAWYRRKDSPYAHLLSSRPVQFILFSSLETGGKGNSGPVMAYTRGLRPKEAGILLVEVLWWILCGFIKSGKLSIFVIDSYLNDNAFTAVKRHAKF